MNISKRVTVSLIDIECLFFYLSPDINLFRNNSSQEMILNFGISSENDIDDSVTFFIIDITNKTVNKAKGLLFVFKSRSCYKLANFHSFPDYAILEKYTFNAFVKHLTLYQSKGILASENEIINDLKLEQFEETLRKEFNRYISCLH